MSILPIAFVVTWGFGLFSSRHVKDCNRPCRQVQSDDQRGYDGEPDFAPLMSEERPADQRAGPAAQQFQKMKCPLADARAPSDRLALVPTVCAERDQAHE